MNRRAGAPPSLAEIQYPGLEDRYLFMRLRLGMLLLESDLTAGLVTGIGFTESDSVYRRLGTPLVRSLCRRKKVSKLEYELFGKPGTGKSDAT